MLRNVQLGIIVGAAKNGNLYILKSIYIEISILLAVCTALIKCTVRVYGLIHFLKICVNTNIMRC